MAAITGNSVNYAIGRYIGPRVFSMNLRFLDRGALMRTHAFYEKHGGKTIVMSRFIPVVRTFAPFVAGVADMPLSRFQLFNILGALLWVVSPVAAGYFFGNIPLVKEHLNTIVLIGGRGHRAGGGRGVVQAAARPPGRLTAAMRAWPPRKWKTAESEHRGEA